MLSLSSIRRDAFALAAEYAQGRVVDVDLCHASPNSHHKDTKTRSALKINTQYRRSRYRRPVTLCVSGLTPTFRYGVTQRRISLPPTRPSTAFQLPPQRQQSVAGFSLQRTSRDQHAQGDNSKYIIINRFVSFLPLSLCGEKSLILQGERIHPRRVGLLHWSSRPAPGAVAGSPTDLPPPAGRSC